MIDTKMILESVKEAISMFGTQPPFSYKHVGGTVEGIKVLYHVDNKTIEVFTLSVSDVGRLVVSPGHGLKEMNLISFMDNHNLLAPAIKAALSNVIYNNQVLQVLAGLIANATKDMTEHHTTKIDYPGFAAAPRLNVYGADDTNPFLVFSLPTNPELYKIKANGITNTNNFVGLEYMFEDVCAACQDEATVRAMVKEYIVPKYLKRAMACINFHECVAVVNNTIFSVDRLRNDLNLRNVFFDLISEVIFENDEEETEGDH